MPKRILSQHSFASGEISPLARFRVSADEYKTGIEVGTNVLLDSKGMGSKRPGFKSQARTKNAANRARLIPYQFSKSIAAALEFGDDYIRVHTTSGLVQNSTTQTITDV